jgi:HlyD family secretion protein
MKHENPPIPSDAIEYQTDSIAIEMQPIPGGARWTLRLLAFLLIFGITWASIATIDKVVTAHGKLISTGKTIVVQPMSAGVITKLYVEEGQEVQEGQILVTLDPTFADADVDGLRERLDSLEQEGRRLESEMGEDADHSSAQSQNALQDRILAARNEEYVQRLISYEQKDKEQIVKIKTKKDQLAQANKQLGLSKDMETMFQNAMQKGVATKLELIKAQSQRMKQEESVERSFNEIQQLRQERQRLQAESDAFVNNWTSTSIQKLVETNREIESIRSQLEKAEHVSDFVELRAPRRAVVLQLATRSEGSVVNKAEPVVTMVPLDEPLEAEVNIEARDIGFVRQGDHARIKLEAFPFQKHGALEGTVKVISEDTFQKESATGTAVTYRSRIELTKETLRNVPADFRLIPGMTLTAEIKVGERKVISYFLYPIMRYLDESLREP